MGRTESCIKLQTESHAGTAVGYMYPNTVQHMGRHVPDVGKQVITRRFAEAERSVQYEIDVKMAQESQDKQIEIVSIDSVHLNRNQSIIMAYLDTFAGKKRSKYCTKLIWAARATSCHSTYPRKYLKTPWWNNLSEL